MPGEIISWVTNQALVNLRKLKLYQASFLTLYQESFPKINYREGKKLLKTHTHTHTWNLSNTLLKNQWIIKEIKEKIKNM